MKPTVPETGRVIRTDNQNAVIMLEGSKSCKGCGAAKIGLCRAGSVSSMFLTAKNTPGAKQGDQVIIGIDTKTQWMGYLLGYIIPLFTFIVGAIIGNLVGRILSVSSLDVIGAFLFFMSSTFFSYRKLRLLDKTKMMEIKRIVSEGSFNANLTSEDEQIYMKDICI